jgi:hypothetical protein
MTWRLTHAGATVSVLCVLVAGAASNACSEEVIVLGFVPASKTSGRSQGARCVTSAECSADTFCDRGGCSNAAGTCEPFPVSCTDDEYPVCGCDGVTYFNDCLRRAAGVDGSVDQECGGKGRSCDDEGAACPNGAVCSRLVGGLHDKACYPMKGRCWVLPAICPKGGRTDRWDECENGPDAVRCIDTCTAIRSGKAFSRALKCE